MTNIGVNLNENQFSNKSLTLSKKSLFCSIIGGFFIDKDYTHNVPSQESERSCVCVLKVYICASVCDSSIGLWNFSDSVVFFVFPFITTSVWRPFKFGARVTQWVRSLDLTTYTSLSPIRRRFPPWFVN